MKKSKFSSLVQDIKNLSEESRSMNRKIRSSRGSERARLRNERRDLGGTTRYLLLAYAFLREKPYHQVERTTRNPVYEASLAKIISSYVSHDLTRDAIHDWIGGSTTMSLSHEAILE